MKFKNQFFVIDTSSLLFDPASLTHFKGNTMVIPISVIQELDRHKDRDDQVGYNARTVNRKLHELKRKGDLSKGVLDEESGVTIKITKEVVEDLPPSLDRNLADDRILSVCFTLRKSKKLSNKVYLITNDLNLGLKATPYGIKSFEFEPQDRYVSSNYQGHRELAEADDLLIDLIYQHGSIPAPARLNAIENEFFLIKNSITNKSIRCICKNNQIIKLDKESSIKNIKELNNEQFYAMNLLMDPKIKLVTLTGVAGTGKTLLSIAAALAQTLDRHPTYDRIVLSRSLVVMSGRDKLGFLKGSLREKLDPYLLPLKDAIDQVLGKEAEGFDYLTATTEGIDKKPQKAKIEIEPLQYIRGRSLRDVFFIVDESQNLTIAEIKTIVSRMGEGSKIILLGDVDQIDNPYVGKQTNGLTQLVEKFKGSKLAGHVTLSKGVRSELASEAALRL